MPVAPSTAAPVARHRPTRQPRLAGRLLGAILVSWTLVAQAASALAEGCFGDGSALFHCTFEEGAKAVDICLQDNVLVYRFGPTAGAAQLVLARSVERVDMTPWPGVGRTIWEEIGLESGDYRYTVHRAQDRMIADSEQDDEPAARGGITISRSTQVIAKMDCDAGSVTTGDFYPLFEAKSSVRQCWDHETFAWKAC